MGQGTEPRRRPWREREARRRPRRFERLAARAPPPHRPAPTPGPPASHSTPPHADTQCICRPAVPGAAARGGRGDLLCAARRRRGAGPGAGAGQPCSRGWAVRRKLGLGAKPADGRGKKEAAAGAAEGHQLACLVSALSHATPLLPVWQPPRGGSVRLPPPRPASPCPAAPNRTCAALSAGGC